MRILVISSFVLPHAGGVEQFVATVRRLLEAPGTDVRVLACRPPEGPTSADVAVPARYLGRGGWPLPTGGWRVLWEEVSAADLVIANNARQALTIGAVLLARAAGVPAVLIVHGSGAGPANGSAPVRAARRIFERGVARPVVRGALPVSVSLAGIEGVRRAYGVQARYLPYPVQALPPAPPVPAAALDGHALRVVWVGRLAPEKDPELAVHVVERLRTRRAATLELYGDGPLRPRLERLAASRPWLTLAGERPWDEVVAVQAAAHACLSTSRADNVQVAVLEALTRGIPTVSTAVGDAPEYYRPAALRPFCVPPGDADALAGALGELADGYAVSRSAFGENAQRLRAVHDGAARVLGELIAHAAPRTRSR